MTAELTRWMMADPMLVLERKQGMEQAAASRTPEAKQHRARQELQQLFEGKEMGRRLEISPKITTTLHQWGEWANRPQFWANLSATPFCKLLGIAHGREAHEIRLDPQSMQVHKTFLRMRCKVTQAVLAGYYVAGCNWDERQALYVQYGISRKDFYEVLKNGSIALFNAAKL